MTTAAMVTVTTTTGATAALVVLVTTTKVAMNPGTAMVPLKLLGLATMGLNWTSMINTYHKVSGGDCGVIVGLMYKPGGEANRTKDNVAEDNVAEDNATEDDEDDEIEEDDSDCIVPFDIPVEGVNHSLKFTLGVEWDDFRWEVARKLRAHPMDIKLSYKLASQPKTEMPRALADENDLADLMYRSRPYVNGTKKCGRGKEFCVQLIPKIPVSKSADEKPKLTQTKKVCLCF